MSKAKAINWSDSTNVNFPDDILDYSNRTNTGYVDPKGEDTSENFAALPGSREFPDSLWIEPRHWKDKARENDKYGLWAISTREKLGRWTNQSPTHECTVHSLCQGAEAAIRVQSGFQYNIALSQISIYAEANPGIRGGANCLHVLSIAMNRGFLPEPAKTRCIKGGKQFTLNQKDIFAHTLHGTQGKGTEWNTRGEWVPVSRFPDGWQETARQLRPIEAVNPRSFDQAVCLLLHGYVVNVGRNGHAVPWGKVVWRGGGSDPYDGIAIPYDDSYEVIRVDSYGTARGAIGGASSITAMEWTPKVFEDAFYDAK